MQTSKAARLADFQRLNDLNWQLFPSRVEDMNKAFERPVNVTPRIHPDGAKRVRQFVSMLAGKDFFATLPSGDKCELKEAIEVIELLDQYERDPVLNEHLFVKAMAKFADLLGDIVVYAISESIQWGLPMGNVLHKIMESQESKLVNGKPVPGDMPGKFGKGPNYKAPDQEILYVIEEAIQLGKMSEIVVKG